MSAFGNLYRDVEQHELELEALREKAWEEASRRPGQWLTVAPLCYRPPYYLSERRANHV